MFTFVIGAASVTVLKRRLPTCSGRAVAMALIEIFPNESKLSMYGLLMAQGLPWQQKGLAAIELAAPPGDGLAPDRTEGLGQQAPRLIQM